MAAWLFIVPAAAFYAIFVLWPLIGTFRFSLFEWNGVAPTMRFVGAANYLALLQDSHFWLAARNMSFWVALKLVLTIAPALLLAVAMQNVRWWRAFFRTTLFFPHLLALSVVGVVWARIYDPFIGLFGKGWLGGTDTALFGLVLANSWQGFGFFMVLFMAGLQNIDQSVYDAAEIDGATRFQQFYAITLPLLRRTTTLVAVLALIGSMKSFEIIWATTQGGPFFSTEVLTTYTYRLAFARDSVGLGSAVSMILGLLIISATALTMRIRGGE